MSEINVIEIFPKMVDLTEDCCDDDSTNDCCEEDVVEGNLKEQLTLKYDSSVSILLYNYRLKMDKLMAIKKLKPLLKNNGFENIKSDEILKFATPAVVVNGNLISYADQPELEHVIKFLN